MLSSARDDLKRAKRDQKFEQNSPSTHAVPHPHKVSAAGGGTGGKGGSGAAGGAVGAAKGTGVGDVLDVHSSVKKVMKELKSQTCFEESGTLLLSRCAGIQTAPRAPVCVVWVRGRVCVV